MKQTLLALALLLATLAAAARDTNVTRHAMRHPQRLVGAHAPPSLRIRARRPQAGRGGQLAEGKLFVDGSEVKQAERRRPGARAAARGRK
jgi:hypothetical protein